jgi:hypothetical protein
MLSIYILAIVLKEMIIGRSEEPMRTDWETEGESTGVRCGVSKGVQHGRRLPAERASLP